MAILAGLGTQPPFSGPTHPGRSGARSHRAAAACTESGRGGCYNVLEGFEGDLDKATGHRNELNGWKQRGLPWTQS